MKNNTINNIKNKNINKNEDEKEIIQQNRKKEKKRKRYKHIKKDTSIKSIMIKKEPPIKKQRRKNIIQNYSINVIQTNTINPNKNISKYLNNNSKTIINQKYNKNKQYIFEYNIYELNNLEYSKAIKIDKRNYFQYYLSLLKTKHLLFFSFCKINDYNSQIIKIYLFFYGVYNIIYQLPQVLYSSFISSVLNLIIKTLALTEKNIIKLKQEKKNVKNKKIELIKYLYYKFMIFFISSFCLLLFIWYYISSFCAIYRNTQIHLIKDTIISFGLSMIYPLGIYLLPGLFRIPALRAPKKDKQFMYKFSKIIQLI